MGIPKGSLLFRIVTNIQAANLYYRVNETFHKSLLLITDPRL